MNRRAWHPVFNGPRRDDPAVLKSPASPSPTCSWRSARTNDRRATRPSSNSWNYCRHSANPVGRLVLYLAECHEPERARLADSVCTGLQLANFCQDVSRDWKKGRLYLPLEDCRAFGVDEPVLAAGRSDQSVRQLVAFQADRAERSLREGLPLVGLMPRDWRLAVALFVHGGLAILEEIRRQNYNVLEHRPVVGRLEKLRLILECWWRLRRGRREEAK